MPLPGMKPFRLAHFDQVPAGAHCGRGDFRHAGEKFVEAGRNIQPRLQCSDDGCHPIRGNEAAVIRNTHNHRPDTALGSLRGRQFRQTEVHLATGQAQLSRT